jgi:hypothetical protein
LSASHRIKISKLAADNTLKNRRSVWTACSPKIEAQALLKLIRLNGSSVETVRELIAIPVEIEELLRSYVARCPEDESAIERVIEFRRCVGEEFDRLVRASQRRRPLRSKSSEKLLDICS